MKKIINFIRVWLDWKKRVSGKKVIDWVRGCGYYLPGQFSSYSGVIGRIEFHNLHSGKIGAACSSFNF
jgi:hypothetical protein